MDCLVVLFVCVDFKKVCLFEVVCNVVFYIVNGEFFFVGIYKGVFVLFIELVVINCVDVIVL